MRQLEHEVKQARLEFKDRDIREKQLTNKIARLREEKGQLRELQSELCQHLDEIFGMIS